MLGGPPRMCSAARPAGWLGERVASRARLSRGGGVSGPRRARVPRSVAFASGGSLPPSESDAALADRAVGDVTRAVLAFHDAERNGNAACDRRGGERTVPLASWARRYGWDVPEAERVLWECDCPTRGGLRVGEASVDVDPEARTVDAALAYVGLWITHVETDHVLRALAERAADPERPHLTKRDALDRARRHLERHHPDAVPVDGTNIARRTTAGAFGDVVKALRRRYKPPETCPVTLITRKIKRRRVYRTVARGDPVPEEWDVVFGGGEGDSRAGNVSDPREDRGEFGVRSEIGASAANSAMSLAERRAARAASWKSASAASDDEADGARDAESSAASMASVEAARRRAARLGAW